MNDGVLYPEESYQIVGAIFEVHKRLGCGFLERVYQEALALEFQAQNIPFEREKHLNIQYREKNLSTDYIADFVCFEKIIIEIKSVDKLQDIHKAQVYNYLKITGYKLGILVNFNEMYISPQRIVL